MNTTTVYRALTRAALGVAACLLVAPLAAEPPFEIATMNAGATAIVWQPTFAVEGMVLTVSGPDGIVRYEFDGSSKPTFGLYDAEGYPLADGSYTWELRAVPALDTQLKSELAAARATGDMAQIEGLQRDGYLPSEPLVQSGYLRIEGGAFVADAEESAGPAARSEQVSSGGQAIRSTSAEVQVINQDLVVQGSECIGVDCASSENFGFDTLRLKENNLRIKFEDTSTGTFPSVDWQLTANDSANGGANRFSIDDVTNNKTPFTVEANAPNHSLYVDDGGKVGIGTSAPVMPLHVVNGNTPTLRLDQDGSSGFTPQTWDLAGNEANFFIRDVTNGSALPFRIEPGTASNMLYLDSAERVGIGTNGPTNTLHVQRADGSASVRIEDTSATAELSQMLVLRSEDGQGISFENDGDGRIWSFINNQNGNFAINSTGGPGNEFLINGNNGNVTISGNLVTGGGGACDPGPCDGTFAPDYEITPIEEHAAYMWANRYLWGVGPTPEGAPLNLTKKVTGILHELEVAHIYIEQLNGKLEAKDDELAELTGQRLPELERTNAELAARLAMLESLVSTLASE